MLNQKRLRDFGISIGSLPTGERNSITDVEGVTVGHMTLNNDDMKTGVTAILPHPGNLFQEKVMAACHVFNGFGKSVGLVQIEELGTLETPIILTNTFSVGVCTDALVQHMLQDNPEIGRTTGTVNPVVCECNDMKLNDIRAGFVEGQHVVQAIQSASEEFEEGGIGAGTGMVCFGMKGGIGSASRKIELNHGTYTFGVLVLSNFGRTEDFVLSGQPTGKRISESLDKNEPDKGSIILVVATDLPVTERQLNRIIKRSGVGLNRTGSFIGNGSGDIVLGFTTAHKFNHSPNGQLNSVNCIHEDEIDHAFYAVAEATEEAILNSLVTAKTTIGRDGNTVRGLNEFIGDVLG